MATGKQMGAPQTGVVKPKSKLWLFCPAEPVVTDMVGIMDTEMASLSISSCMPAVGV